MGYSPWGRKESDTTERLNFHLTFTQSQTGKLEAHSVAWKDGEAEAGCVCVCVCVCACVRVCVCVCTHMPVVHVGVCMACVY